MERATIVQAADYCILYDWTLREIAENMMVGKTTVYRWLTEELKHIDYDRYKQCERILRDRRTK